MEGPALDLFKAKLEAVMAEARSQQAASMTEFHWLGHKFPISNAKTRVSILKAQELEKDLDGPTAHSLPAEKRLAIFDKIFAAYHDARSCIRSDLANAGNSENMKDDLSGLDKAIGGVLGLRTIERNKLLVSVAKSKLSKTRDDKNEKVTKPEELVRLYDLLSQNTADLLDLVSSGRDTKPEELAFMEEYSVKSLVFRAQRCFYLAKSYSSAGKRAEAYLLFSCARSLASNALGKLQGLPTIDQVLNKELKTLVVDSRSSSCIEHAVAKNFPVKPKLKPTSKKPASTAESKYWRSFKSQPTETLSNSVTSLCFSPTSPHDFAASHSGSVTIFNAESLDRRAISNAFPNFATSVSYRSDGRLLAAGSHGGTVKVFDVKSRTALRTLHDHTKQVHMVRYPRIDRLHLFSGGDDAVVKYWDVATEKPIVQLMGHKDYVRSGDGSPVSDEMFVTGSYDHTVKVWDVRASKGGPVMELNHGKNLVEDVVYLPSGGLIATASSNELKIWDLIGGGKLLYTMESHNKTVTSICVGNFGKQNGEEAKQYRILSVSLDGFMKVFDYAKFKVTHSLRFPHPLLSIAVSPDSSTRVIGTPNGTLYVGKRKIKENSADVVAKSDGGLGPISEAPKRVLTPAYFRYFYRGQSEKPSKGDFIVSRAKKVKVAEHDKLLKKFRHKEALVSTLMRKNPENVVAVMEELVARRKLLKCVMNLENEEELEMLLVFLQKYSTVPRYAGLLLKLGKKVIEMRGEDVKNSDAIKGYVRNLKRSVEEEVRIQQSLQEIQGVISPLLRIAGRR